MHIVWDIYVVKLDIPLSFLRWIPDVIRFSNLDQHVTFLHEIIRSNYVDAYVFCTPLLSAHLSLAHPKPCLLPAMVTFYLRFWSSMKLN